MISQPLPHNTYNSYNTKTPIVICVCVLRVESYT